MVVNLTGLYILYFKMCRAMLDFQNFHKRLRKKVESVVLPMFQQDNLRIFKLKYFLSETLKTRTAEADPRLQLQGGCG